MIKWEHSIFALPFAFLGLVLAGETRISVWLFVTLAMVSFRTSGMAWNRLADRAIDAANPRTKMRALPAGKIGTGFVALATLASLAVFETSSYLLGPLCFKLSVVPLFLAFLYPFAKKFTWSSHFILGMILGIAPYGAWIASRQEFSWVPGFLTLGVTAWVAGFDMIYALQDEDFDRSHGLYSFPARFGQSATLILTRILHVLTLMFWFLAGQQAGLGAVYFAGLAGVGFFLFREHWLVRRYGLAKIHEAFFTMNAVVSIAVFLAVLVDLRV